MAGPGGSVVYLAVRFAARGKIGMLGGLVIVLAAIGIAIAATPLQGLISQRLDHGKSNAVRTSLSVSATQDGLASPLIGYGDTRHQQGSVKSIAVGRSTKCQQCGEVTIGSNGQLWLLLICNGILGTLFYLGLLRLRRVPLLGRRYALWLGGRARPRADVRLHDRLYGCRRPARHHHALLRPALAK